MCPSSWAPTDSYNLLLTPAFLYGSTKLEINYEPWISNGLLFFNPWYNFYLGIAVTVQLHNHFHSHSLSQEIESKGL
jgi:hypothetical protein